MSVPITPDMLVAAYRWGAFPMAESRDGPIHWYSPDPRGIVPLDGFHISRSLARRLRRGEFHLTFDRAFEQVVRECARARPDDHDTWINDEIIELYTQVHRLGMAHSAEAWRDGSCSELVGGVYGVSLGGAFFGESMFSRATDASKCCLANLVGRLRGCGFVLFDTQYVTPHLTRLGAVEVSREVYTQMLAEAVDMEDRWCEGVP